MPKTNTSATAPARRAQADSRTPVTFEMAQALAPTMDQLTKIIRMFGLDDIDLNDMRNKTEAHLCDIGAAMTPAQDPETVELSIKIHLDRLVGSYVGSAYGAAGYYDTKRDTAREMGSKFNENRDEDGDGPAGFENALQRAQMNAARAGIISAATLAQAEGALSAYRLVVGSPWKPYVADTEASRNVTRQATTARAAAFD